MNTFKKLFLLTCCSVIALPALAQERHLTEAEINELFEQMLLKQELLVDTDEIELEDKQREEIAEEILAHYTENFTIKFKHRVIADDGTVGTPFQAQANRFGYKYGLAAEKDYNNLTSQYKIKDIEFMGQRAIVKVTLLFNYKIDMTDYDHDPEITANALSNQDCEYHIKIDFDDMPRITHEQCTIKTLISNIEMHDESDYKEAARYLCDPPKRKANYILDYYDQRTSENG
jgi:hypothetical protein